MPSREEILEIIKAKREKWEKAYPIDIFPEPEGKLDDVELTRQSAKTMRVMLPRIFDDITHVLLDKYDNG